MLRLDTYQKCKVAAVILDSHTQKNIIVYPYTREFIKCLKIALELHCSFRSSIFLWKTTVTASEYNYPGILYSHTKVPKRRLKVYESNAAAPVISYPHTKKLKMLARKCIRVVILLHLCHIFTQNEQSEEKVVIL